MDATTMGSRRAPGVRRRDLVLGASALLVARGGPVVAADGVPAVAAAPGRGGYGYLGGRVDEATPRRVLEMLEQAVAAGLGRLVLVLNSRGGDVSSGLAAHQLLKAAPLEVTTYNIGSVESIGVFVFLAGSRRVAHPQSSFLMHGIRPAETGDRSGRRHDAELRALTYDKEWEILRDTTRLTEAEFRRMMRGQRIFRAEEARRTGLATEVAALPFRFGDVPLG